MNEKFVESGQVASSDLHLPVTDVPDFEPLLCLFQNTFLWPTLISGLLGACMYVTKMCLPHCHSTHVNFLFYIIKYVYNFYSVARRNCLFVNDVYILYLQKKSSDRTCFFVAVITFWDSYCYGKQMYISVKVICLPIRIISNRFTLLRS